ncbi:hypothetical protein AAZX31_17G204200 [Glycine max]
MIFEFFSRLSFRVLVFICLVLSPLISGFFSKLFFCVFVFRLLGLAEKPKGFCLVIFSSKRKTQRSKLFGLVWQFFAWVGRKMIFGFFSRLSFCVLVFHLLGSFTIDFWVLSVQKLGFFCDP